MGRSHEWGDEGFDWNALNQGCDFIDKILKFFRIGVHSKEKWGTRRESLFFWDGSLHHLIYPGYVYNQFPKWLWHLDCLYIRKFMQKIRIVRPIVWFQVKVYIITYYFALKKYPHVAEELCICAEGIDLLIGINKLKKKWAEEDLKYELEEKALEEGEE